MHPALPNQPFGKPFGKLITLAAALSAALLATPAPAETALIRDVAVFDGEGPLPRRSVLIRDGRIADADFKGATPKDAREVRCDGCTLLPGLIDSHVHAYANHELPVLLGVTTQLDMFMQVAQARGIKTRMAAGKLRGEADLFTAGTLVTAPGGHGTEYGFPIPTLSRPEDADAFVRARIDEGSDFIKLVYDDGKRYHIDFPTLDLATLRAAIEAAHRYGKLAVVHVSTRQAAREAIEAGADGLAHLFADIEADEDWLAQAARRNIFVVPTYTVLESVAGRAGGAGLLEAPAIAAVLDDGQRGALAQSMRKENGSAWLDRLMAADLPRLRRAGIPVLAGTDAGNPGVLHGASLHRELELLVQAGLAPGEALYAATAGPADAFRLADRGRIANGLKADLLLVHGDPTVDIRATRAIAEVWKDGEPAGGLRAARIAALAAERAAAAQRRSQPLPADGRIGLFAGEDGGLKLAAPFGQWLENTDAVMNGKSTVTLTAGQAPDGGTSVVVAGELKAGSPFPWAGLAFNPGGRAFAPTDLSRSRGIRFKVRGDGATYGAQAFWQAGGYQPAALPFAAGADWREVSLAWSDFAGFDPKTATWLGLVAAMRQGPFRFEIADVRLIVD